MPVLSILSTSYSHGDAVAQGATERLLRRAVSEADLVTAGAYRSRLQENSLLRSLSGEAGLLSRLTHGQERGGAHLRSALPPAAQDPEEP